MELTLRSRLRPHGRITLYTFDAERAPDYVRAQQLRRRRSWLARERRNNLSTQGGLNLFAAAINWAGVQSQNAQFGQPFSLTNLGYLGGAVGTSSTAATANDTTLNGFLACVPLANAAVANNQVVWDFFLVPSVGNGTIWEAGAYAQTMSPPPQPTVVVTGTIGSTTYTYFVVATGLDPLNNSIDSTPSPTQSVSTGNATLSSSNYNAISWASVAGATGYKVIRSVGGATTGVIATLSSATLSYNDQGAAATLYTSLLNPSGILLDHTVLVSSVTKLNTQTGILEVTFALSN
jgi:hypothetical protein